MTGATSRHRGPKAVAVAATAAVLAAGLLLVDSPWWPLKLAGLLAVGAATLWLGHRWHLAPAVHARRVTHHFLAVAAQMPPGPVAVVDPATGRAFAFYRGGSKPVLWTTGVATLRQFSRDPDTPLVLTVYWIATWPTWPGRPYPATLKYTGVLEPGAEPPSDDDIVRIAELHAETGVLRTDTTELAEITLQLRRALATQPR